MHLMTFNIFIIIFNCIFVQDLR